MPITNKEVTNKVDLVAPRHSAPANGCNWISLNEGGDTNQSVSYDIVHTLGSEDGIDISFDTVWSSGVESTSVGDGVINIISTAGVYDYVTKYSQTQIQEGNTYIIEVVCSSYVSGFLSLSTGGDSIVLGVSSTGVFSTEFTAVGNSTKIEFTRGGITDITLSDYSIKQVTNANSYLTTLPKASGSHVTSDMPLDTPSATYPITTSHANTFTTDVPLTEADRVLLDANPNLVAQLKFGDLTTGLSFNAINVKSLWLGNGGINTGAYEQDLCVDLGANKHTATNATLSSSDEVSTFTAYANNGFDLAVTTVGTSTSHPRVLNDTTAVMNIDETYIISFDATVNSGTPLLFLYLIGSGVSQDVSYTILDGSNEILLSPTTLGQLSRMYFDGTNLFDIEIRSWEVKEATATEIQAYTANCRTLHANTNLGVNNLKLTQDASGRATGYLGDGEMAFANADGRGLPLSLYLNEERYRFTEVIQLADTTKEYRVLEHDANTDGLGTEVNSLYVNGVLVSSLPTLPNPATLITLGDTAIIGNPDTITRRYKAVNLDDATQPNVLSTDIKTAQDALDEYNAWLLLGY